MKKYLIDTNVLLRLILKDDLNQLKKIQNLLIEVESEKVKLYCASISLFETAFILMGKMYNLSKPKTAQILQTLLKLKVIEFQDLEIFNTALDIFVSSNISFPDCYLLAKAKLDKLTFFSFDAKANKVFKQL